MSIGIDEVKASIDELETKVASLNMNTEKLAVSMDGVDKVFGKIDRIRLDNEQVQIMNYIKDARDALQEDTRSFRETILPSVETFVQEMMLDMETYDTLTFPMWFELRQVLLRSSKEFYIKCQEMNESVAEIMQKLKVEEGHVERLHEGLRNADDERSAAGKLLKKFIYYLRNKDEDNIKRLLIGENSALVLLTNSIEMMGSIINSFESYFALTSTNLDYIQEETPEAVELAELHFQLIKDSAEKLIKYCNLFNTSIGFSIAIIDALDFMQAP